MWVKNRVIFHSFGYLSLEWTKQIINKNSKNYEYIFEDYEMNGEGKKIKKMIQNLEKRKENVIAHTETSDFDVLKFPHIEPKLGSSV